ncbi:NAD(P)-dependent oxidoreductase [Advenella sp. S44]|uniref:SDR family oxidoreductase n=1 Tax=Advenella sp. S44 TaxID=1982755 RepID=UPI000C298BA7|nr:SDR family oxidoreductase [Advenella sp. S44]PJX25969.1 NAD(P)-dependent oxidoreductase [Advenella sp. S44]
MTQTMPAQEQQVQPGRESKMHPAPVYDDPNYKAGGKLKDKVALITGGDSGIGRATTIAFAKEGARIAIVYLEEDKDATETKQCAEKYGSEVLLIKGDIGDVAFAKKCVTDTFEHFGTLDILVNNAGEQHTAAEPEDISYEQLLRTFQTNFFSIVTITLEALKLMREGASIINTSSITAFQGNPDLIDYSATKGAITAFTRSLSTKIVSRQIRVNSVAPGPIWTPLIPASFSADKVAKFGKDTPMGRPGQPFELAPAYVYLASSDSTYVTGQTIHVNGGKVING